jgi:hypothetical protein
LHLLRIYKFVEMLLVSIAAVFVSRERQRDRTAAKENERRCWGA